MTQIDPFPGLRYNPSKVKNLDSVISPPYDKVSPEERKILWNRSDLNVVRLILPPPSEHEIDVATQSTGTESGNWYEEAASRLQEWIQNNILTMDPPCLYMYQQTFHYEGNAYTRKGFFGALKLDEKAGARAHEFTFEGPKADRLRLTRATQTNLSPIFLLTDGEEQEWEKLFQQADKPLVQFKDQENQEHALFGVTDSKKIQAIQYFFKQRTLVIADGHHRYETALNYRREMLEKTGKDPDQEPWGSTFAFLTPIDSPGLLVLPTHRVVAKMPENWFDRLSEKVKSYCDIKPIDNLSKEHIRETINQSRNRQGIVAVSPDKAALFDFDQSAEIPALDQVPQPIRKLNVSILHQFLLNACLELFPDDLSGITRYVRGEEDAVSMIRQGEFQGAFLLGGLSPKTVFNVSLEGVRMPQKSTDFYPKIPTGLVIRSVS